MSLTFSPKTTRRIIAFFAVTNTVPFTIGTAAIETGIAAACEVYGYRWLAIAFAIAASIDYLRTAYLVVRQSRKHF